MFKPGNIANPNGRNGKDGVSTQLRAALNIAAKKHNTTVFGEYSKLFFSYNPKVAMTWRLALLPYIVPKLKSLEVSGEVTVPFQFIIKRSNGEAVQLPAPTKQITSSIVNTPLANSIAKRKTIKARRKPAAKRKTKHAKTK